MTNEESSSQPEQKSRTSGTSLESDSQAGRKSDTSGAARFSVREEAWKLLFEPGTWTVLLLALFGGTLLIAIISDKPALTRLADPAYARGVITWIVSLATIAIAFVLIYQAFLSEESSDDRFRRGREIFTGLMGVLGTIVGFYFGSTEQPNARPSIADVRIEGTQLTTYVSGGVAPYRYKLAYGSVTSEDEVSNDGWIVESLEGDVPLGTEVKVTVTDAKNQEASKVGKVGAARSPADSP